MWDSEEAANLAKELANKNAKIVANVSQDGVVRVDFFVRLFGFRATLLA